MSSEKVKLSEKVNVFFIYGIVLVIAIILILSFVPIYNIRIETSQLVLVSIVVVLLLFQYFKVIEIPGFLKLSKEIGEIKSETKEIRQAQMTLMQAFTVSQSAMASNVVYVNPIIKQAVKDAAEEAETLISEMPISITRGVVPSESITITGSEEAVELIDAPSRVIIESEISRIKTLVEKREYIAAFALMRNRIENLLKDVLGVGQNETRRFHQLLRDGKKRELLTPPLFESIMSFQRFANLVIHMPYSAERELSPTSVDTIVDLGIRAIDELESIKRRPKSTTP